MPTADLRPATLADAPAVTALLNEIDRIEIGRPETDQHTVEADLTHQQRDLAQDSWLALDAGRPVAYGPLWDESGGERIDIDHYVLPDHRRTGLRMLIAMETRAPARARANGAERAVVHLHLNTRPTTDTALLAERGWSVVRTHHVLRRALDPAVDLPPEAPAGVRLRACATEADRVRVHELYQRSFAQHFDFQPRPYRLWLDAIDAAGLDWSLVWIAETDDLGGFLLRHAFARFAARGRDTVGLGVDTAHATGAPRLHGRNGMTVHFAVDTWEAVIA
ncbi:N-acetyltransferase family protein [Streptomyces violaceoruber]|uniref:GNAT family N-acetyltransferase n=1 Tax=Streptomyces violaceoruber group TaxID=2867121 RepID=UPI00365A7C23